MNCISAQLKMGRHSNFRHFDFSELQVYAIVSTKKHGERPSSERHQNRGRNPVNVQNDTNRGHRNLFFTFRN